MTRITIGFVLACLGAACATPVANRGGTTASPLVIQEQGSFAVGGSVVTAPGTFDPIAQGAYTPTPRSRGKKHAAGDYPRDAGRATLFWHISARGVAGILPRRAVLSGLVCAESVLPADGAEHWAL